MEGAAIREMYEEPNLEIDDLELFDIFSGKEYYYQYPNGDEVYNVIATYTTDRYSGYIKPDMLKSKDARFFNIYKLPENLIRLIDLSWIDLLRK